MADLSQVEHEFTRLLEQQRDAREKLEASEVDVEEDVGRLRRMQEECQQKLARRDEALRRKVEIDAQVNTRREQLAVELQRLNDLIRPPAGHASEPLAGPSVEERSQQPGHAEGSSGNDASSSALAGPVAADGASSKEPLAESPVVEQSQPISIPQGSNIREQPSSPLVAIPTECFAAIHAMPTWEERFAQGLLQNIPCYAAGRLEQEAEDEDPQTCDAEVKIEPRSSIDEQIEAAEAAMPSTSGTAQPRKPTIQKKEINKIGVSGGRVEKTNKTTAPLRPRTITRQTFEALCKQIHHSCKDGVYRCKLCVPGIPISEPKDAFVHLLRHFGRSGLLARTLYFPYKCHRCDAFFALQLNEMLGHMQKKHNLNGISVQDLEKVSFRPTVHARLNDEFERLTKAD